MTRAILCLAWLAATGSAAGCFNLKSVQSGGLKCASDGSCPDGFFCGEEHLCYRNGTAGVNLCTVAQAQAPLGPFPACTPPSQSVALCDPVCQSGCSCSHRCEMVGDAIAGYSFACQTPPSGTSLDTFQPCDSSNDLCKPGQTCLPPPTDSTGCVAVCYRYCRLDGDCPVNSYCVFSIDLGGQQAVSICSPPVVACDPSLASAAPTCASSTVGTNCYVFSSDFPDKTMCDCPGTIKAGAPCSDLHSCVAGYECAQGKCQKTCLLSAGASASCASGQTCVSLFGTSTKFGICQ